MLCISSTNLAHAAPPYWGQALKADAQAMHDILGSDHPGTIDLQNPQFAVNLDKGLEAIKTQAAVVRTAGGWYWALKGYAALFDDAHLQVVFSDTAPALPTRWAGFLTRYSRGELIVAYRDPAMQGLPAVGARLLACDGIPADKLAAARVGRFVGQWSLEAQRTKFAAWLVEDRGNPWLTTLRSCRFSFAGRERSYATKWRPIAAVDLAAAEARAMPKRRTEFAYRQLEDSTWWLSFPDFSGNPQGADFKILTSVIARMRADQRALRGARRIVLDVRGNGGGSSAWGDDIAATIWDDDWRAAHPVPRPQAVDWRVSRGNIAALQGYVDSYKASGSDASGLEEEVTAMKAADQAHEIWWHQPMAFPSQAAADRGRTPQVKVFVLTDEWCFSACLDAVDEWKADGAVQVGRATGADTLYIENKLVPLPSGKAQLAVSMKVYRAGHEGTTSRRCPSMSGKEAWMTTRHSCVG